MAKPRFEPTDQQRGMVEAYAAFGMPQEEMCLLILNPDTGKPLSLKTLHRAFRGELDTGMIMANAKVAESLFRQAVGGPAVYDSNGKLLRAEQLPSVGASIFWLKARAGWSEKNRVELTGANGGPIETMDLSKLSDADLEKLAEIAGKAGAAVTDTDQGGAGAA